MPRTAGAQEPVKGQRTGRFWPCPGNAVDHPQRLIACAVYKKSVFYFRCALCRFRGYFDASSRFTASSGFTLEQANAQGMEPL